VAEARGWAGSGLASSPASSTGQARRAAAASSVAAPFASSQSRAAQRTNGSFVRGG
jgi:hypothetical protein